MASVTEVLPTKSAEIYAPAPQGRSVYLYRLRKGNQMEIARVVVTVEGTQESNYL